MGKINMQLFDDVIEKCKSDKKGLNKLKNALVSLEEYELASELRAMEKELFPESEEKVLAKKIATQTANVLSMTCTNVKDLKTAWVVRTTMEVYFKKKDKFSLMDASKIKAESEILFDED